MTVSFLSRLFRALTLRARVRLVFATHPVSAVISLVQVFVARGAFLRTLGLDFFTFTYIVIYVGAIAVLFLFVIMLLDTRSETLFESKRHKVLCHLFEHFRGIRCSSIGTKFIKKGCS